MLLNNQWIIGEIKEETSKYLETNENESTRIQNLWDIAKIFLKSKDCSNTILPKERNIFKKITNKQSNLTPKTVTKKGKKQNPKSAEGKKL